MVYMYHSFLIHSSADGHLGCFHVLAMINSAAMNIGVHVSLSDLVSLVSLMKTIENHSSILAWKIPWAEEPGGLQSMGLQKEFGHDLATKQTNKQTNKNSQKLVQLTSTRLYWKSGIQKIQISPLNF